MSNTMIDTRRYGEGRTLTLNEKELLGEIETLRDRLETLQHKIRNYQMVVRALADELIQASKW